MSAAVLAQHRAAIVALLASVPDIGIVHDRERYAANEAAFRDLYLYRSGTPEAQLRGWWVRRVATFEASPHVGRTLNVHTWSIRGYTAFRDGEATELVFDALIEQFRALVRTDPTLGGACEVGPLGENEPDGVQVTDAGPVMFAGVLCHSALLQLKTWSYL